MQAVDWLLRLQESPSDSLLRQEFEHWLDASEANRAAYRKVEFISATVKRGSQAAAQSETVIRLPERRRRGLRLIGAGAALVAAACLAFALFPVLQKHMLADYVTGVAQLREVELPDGSTAYLDAGSAIAVNYRGTRREIALLEGQAFFKVVKNSDRPFVVEANKVTVAVSGTAFGVRIAPRSTSVLVESGSVEVSTPSEPTSLLTAGDSLVYDHDSGVVSRRNVPSTTIALWRSRRLMIHEEPFEDILEEVGRHVPGAIILRDKSLNRQLVTGVFDLSNPSDALQALAGSQDAQLTQITPYLIIVSRR